MSDPRDTSPARRLHGRWWPLLPVSLVLAGCAGQPTDGDVLVTRPGEMAPIEASANATFAAADTDGDGTLSPQELESLGLGGNWHTLDLDGNGQLSPREFRETFAMPLVQATLTLPSDPTDLRPAVSDSYRLPPLSEEQNYRPSPVTGLSSSSLSLPSGVPVMVPVLLDDEDAANIDRAAQRVDAAPDDTDGE
ncbi:EF-hand domain-containing protein [Salinicola halophilus]|uniref:EF-hand domain-containing protein n=1 Tax=Salinicola halophilus TaxID=184065 RepID=UPI000DA116A8|nr:EF-hand domain-containing protein [Salinicola halophilus]